MLSVERSASKRKGGNRKKDVTDALKKERTWRGVEKGKTDIEDE